MDQTPETPRQKLLRRIKALLQMTVARGCTEGEALAALDKARDLMDEYDVSETDLTFGGESAKIHTEPKGDRDDIRARLALAVGAFCGCQGFKNGFERIAYVGLYADTVFSHWLLDTLDEFVQRECRNYLESNPSPYRVRRLETRGFIIACADRLAERLYALAKRATNTDLTVQKNALIAAAMSAAGIQLHTRFTLRRIDPAAAIAGVAAGDRATFDKAVNERRGPAPLEISDARPQ